MKKCFLFPGQGAQYPGMGKDLWEASSEVKKIFECASDTSGIDVKKILFDGSDEDLKKTDNAQIAITVVSLSSAFMLKDKGIIPEAAAGFSLGEYAALVESGIIKMEDIFPLVRKRGEIMEKASRALDKPEGSPGMAAVIGLDYDSIIKTISNTEGVYAANYNSPVQIVLSGTFDGLNNAEALCKEAGAKRFIRLKVSGPFHSPLITDAMNNFKEVVDKVEFSDPVIDLYSNVTAEKIKSGNEARELCLKQIISTVKWVDEEKNLLAAGYDSFYEAGPGKVLAGLFRSFDSSVPCQSAGTAELINNCN